MGRTGIRRSRNSAGSPRTKVTSKHTHVQTCALFLGACSAPSSVFAIRSQKDPSMCIGARPIPDPEVSHQSHLEPEADRTHFMLNCLQEPELIAPKPIDYDTALEV